jgi:4-hydroxybenzoate polyprenyltransferase
MIDYIKIARLDHWFKNIFMLPGMALALIFTNASFTDSIPAFLLGILSTCFIASANYVINEWLDAEFDRHHPVKKSRPSAVGNIKAHFVYLEWFIFAVMGLGLAALLTPEFVIFSVILLVMGVVYNVMPMRTKDRALLDVLSESVNNPLRLLLGWSAVISGQLPPSSIVLAYWMGGAFLMAVKRYAEFRFIDDPERARLYRKSFGAYTENSLLLSAFFYALTSSFFLGIFLIKYRVEFLLSFPLFALLFTWYLAIGMKPHSATQNPEKLYRERGFIAFVLLLGAVVAALFVVDIPFLHMLVNRVVYTQ